MTREEAKQNIIALRDGLIEWFGLNDEGSETFRLAIAALEQPERKNGRWIYSAGTAGTGTTALRFFPTCSECGVEHFTTNFCPNCGADMRVDETCE